MRMDVFLMHVGHLNTVDIEFTVTRDRTFSEVVAKLPADAPERPYFHADPELHGAFPNGAFNCWGVPSRAEPSFAQTKIGDLVLIVPFIGIHGGGIAQLGVVRAKCPIRCHQASRVLWPKTPDARLFPLIFFFRTEVGFRGWFEFLEDAGYKSNWDPRGWYRRIAPGRFDAKFGGPAGYLRFLRNECGFGALNSAV